MRTSFDKNYYLQFTFLLSCFFAANVNSQTASIVKDSTTVTLADPTIYKYNGLYYLYGTGNGATGNGFVTYTSSNLKSWKLKDQNNGYVLRKGESFGTSGFWAPQVFAYNSNYYMAYVANENIAIAESDSPAGPFRQTTKQPLAAPVKQIDPFVFIDDDGRKYLYHVRLDRGNNIYVAELNDDLSSIKTETLKACITASEKWENIANAPWPVTEGPSIIKHKGNYYLFYTANDFRNINYAVGYATSSSPFGPWKKYERNPILYRSLIGQNGTGHGDFFIKKHRYYYVFHTHNSATAIHPRKTGIIEGRFYKTRNGIDRFAFIASTFFYCKKK